jgi:lysophospholipase L1-like esterase
MRIAFVGDSLTAGVPGCSYFDLLQERLPEHTLFNLGKGNDTVLSLYRRMREERLPDDLDLIFFWVGVNDVRRNAGWLFRLFNMLLGQRGTDDPEEFRRAYEATLDLLSARARRIVAVSPFLKGEDAASRENRRLQALAEVVADLARQREEVRHLDLRTPIVERLKGLPTSTYLPSTVLDVALDVVARRECEQVNHVSAVRGLHFTLDGVHLNGRGAKFIADAFAGVVDELTREEA